jgi:hypothetical protein
MSLALTPPSAELLSDLDKLEATVHGDSTGDKTRRLAKYFAQAETLSQQAQLRATDFEEKTFAALVGDAFAASRRIVLLAWQKHHGRELTT